MTSAKSVDAETIPLVGNRPTASHTDQYTFIKPDGVIGPADYHPSMIRA